MVDICIYNNQNVKCIEMLQLQEKLETGQSPSEQAAGILQNLETLLGKEEGLSNTNMDPAQLDAFNRTL